MGFLGRIRDSFNDLRENVTERISRIFNRDSEDGDYGLEGAREVVKSSEDFTTYNTDRLKIISDFDAFDLDSSVEELEQALEVLEAWGGDWGDIVRLSEMGLPLEEIEYITLLESPPNGAKLRYEFPFIDDAIAWVLDVGAYGYFAVSEFSGGYAVWEMDG